MDDEARRARIASNEAVFREVNERIETLNARFTTVTDSMAIVCECGDASCADQIEVSLELYEQVRSDPTLFIVAPGHVIEDVEEIVSSHDGYDVVRKHQPIGKAVAEATDPRA